MIQLLCRKFNARVAYKEERTLKTKEELIEEKSDGVFGAMTGLMQFAKLVSDEDFALLCDNIPSGEHLWLEFKKYRDIKFEGFGMLHYFLGKLVKVKPEIATKLGFDPATVAL